jgi:hypothetical protein
MGLVTMGYVAWGEAQVDSSSGFGWLNDCKLFSSGFFKALPSLFIEWVRPIPRHLDWPTQALLRRWLCSAALMQSRPSPGYCIVHIL